MRSRWLCGALGRAQTDDIKTLFGLCVRSLPPQRIRRSMESSRCWRALLVEGCGRPAELAVVAAALIRRSLSPGNPLLRPHLETTPVRDIALERWLTGERRRLLVDGAEGSLGFACALARGRSSASNIG